MNGPAKRAAFQTLPQVKREKRESSGSLAHLSIISRPSINFCKTYYSRYVHCFAFDILVIQRVQMQFFLITSSRVCWCISSYKYTVDYTYDVHGYAAKSKFQLIFSHAVRAWSTHELNKTEIDNKEIFENRFLFSVNILSELYHLSQHSNIIHTHTHKIFVCIVLTIKSLTKFQSKVHVGLIYNK